MKLITYQAILSTPNNIARIQAAKRAIEGIGGKLTVAPPNKAGMTLITLALPEQYYPDQFFPGVPFYPL